MTIILGTIKAISVAHIVNVLGRLVPNSLPMGKKDKIRPWVDLTVYHEVYVNQECNYSMGFITVIESCSNLQDSDHYNG